MDSETYNLIIAIGSLIFTLLTVTVLGLAYILNLANKRANETVPAKTAEKLGDLISPDVLNILMMFIEAGLYGATKTATPADDELFGRIKTEFTPTVKPAPIPEPTVSEIVEGNAQG